MKTCQKTIISNLSLAAFMSLPAAGAVTTAVNWGGQYVDDTLPLAGDTPANRTGSDQYGDPEGPFDVNINETIVGRAFSSSEPFSPPVGYAGTSGTFLGASTVTRMGVGGVNDGFTELGVLNQGPNDSIHWHVDTGGDSHTSHLLIYWDKSNFLGALSTTPNLELGDGAFTISTSQASGNHADELLRWVVRDGSQFYISEATIGLSNNSDFVSPYSTLVNWSAYNPVDPVGAPSLTDLQSIDFDAAGPYLPQSFTDVTGLGFYVEHEAPTGPIHVHIEGFSASLVPEPSGALLCLLGLCMATGLRYRSQS